MKPFKEFYCYRLNNNFLYKLIPKDKFLFLFFQKMSGKIKIPVKIKIILDTECSRIFFILVDKEKDTLIAFQKFLHNLRLCEQAFQNPYKVKIFLKGVGFRVNYFSEFRPTLCFSLGYCHKINVSVPSGVFVTMGGNNKESSTSVFFNSKQKSSLTAFVSSLKKYRKPEYYTGKGLLVINQKNLNRYKLLQKVR